MSVPVLAAASVVPVATALEPAAPAARTSAAAVPVAAGAPSRVLAQADSRSNLRAEPPPPRPGDVEPVAERAVATSRESLVPLWATDSLTVRSDPGAGTRFEVRIDAGEKVQTTGAVQDGWAQIARGARLAWVRRADLSRSRPRSATARSERGSVPAGTSGAPCPDGSAVEAGLTANAVRVYRAVCAAFPAVTSWGGRSGSGDHASGHALDIMATGSLGSSIATYVRAHAGQLGVSYVIWAQHIWTVQRSSEGWRAMPDRGSTTANHYDHVHVTVY